MEKARSCSAVWEFQPTQLSNQSFCGVDQPADRCSHRLVVPDSHEHHSSGLHSSPALRYEIWSVPDFIDTELGCQIGEFPEP